MITLDTKVKELYGIGPKFLDRLNKLHINTVRDLLYHFPFRYDDFSTTSLIADVAPGQTVTICATIEKVNLRHSFKKKMTIVEAFLHDETGLIKAIWFNQPYIKNALMPQKQFNFSGKINLYQGEMTLSNPMYEPYGGVNKHTGRLVPIYPETRGITSKGIRYIVKPLIENLAEITDPIPDFVLDKYNIPDINESLRVIHYPSSIEEALVARRRFAFEEMLMLSLFNLKRKINMSREQALSIPLDVEFIKETLKKLPFTITQAQKRSLFEIFQDMEKSHPMNRLLQGDVGSGKTIVATLAALQVVKARAQVAFMAPTEILARQHYATLTSLIPNIKKVGLVVGGLKGKIFFEKEVESEIGKKELQNKIKLGDVSIVVGTHALIQKDISFKNLGLVIIDEQHRFGVEQRAELLKKVGKKHVPHFLSMSATPIPRTLTLTVFGDLNLSVIDELPQGRKKIETFIIAPDNRNKAYQFIKEQVNEGRQVFVICPRIEISESEMETENAFNRVELKNVKEEFDKLSKKIFPDLKVLSLHGKMKPKEKEEVMKNFKDGKADILVSTSVVEVGVDIPNATIMMIESADRFGLSQLYQFRGRVGRGEHQSYCFLFTESDSKLTLQRLEALKNAKNGFELAEKDLEIRGPGQFIGKRQTGVPDTAMKSLTNLSVIKDVRDAAISILKEDPDLKKYETLKNRLRDFEKSVHEE